jgi:hypothetical protein
MPVLECSCGMVMSVSAAEPRNTCIRCRRADLKPLKQKTKTFRAVQRLKKRLLRSPPTIGQSEALLSFSASLLATIPAPVDLG